MIDLYTWTTPNGRKASIMLEETGLAYEVHPVNIGAGEQFAPEFLKISPNNKIPAIVDRDTGQSVFESGAILIYLAEKSGKLLPASGPARAKVLEWTMWQIGGLGPMLGQVSHFTKHAQEEVPYGIDRYTSEGVRLFHVMDRRLAQARYLGGDEVSIADVASYAWTLYGLPMVEAEKGRELGEVAHVRRWLEDLGARPGFRKGMEIPQV